MIPGYLSPAYVTVSEASRILGCDPRTVRVMMKRGELRYRRIGKHYRVDLESIGTQSVEAGNEPASIRV